MEGEKQKINKHNKFSHMNEYEYNHSTYKTTTGNKPEEKK